MESIKVNSSRMGQMTKHYSIGINGTTGNDLTLDSNGDGSLNILLPEGAIVTAVHVGGIIHQRFRNFSASGRKDFRH